MHWIRSTWLTKRSVFSRYFFQKGLIFLCPPMSQTLSFIPWDATLFMLKPWKKPERATCHWRPEATRGEGPLKHVTNNSNFCRVVLHHKYVIHQWEIGHWGKQSQSVDPQTFFTTSCARFTWQSCVTTLSQGAAEEQIWG